MNFLFFLLFDIYLINSPNVKNKLLRLQARIHLFIQKTKITKFFKKNKSKSINILNKHGYEFLTDKETQELLNIHSFSDNGFSLKFPFLDSSKIYFNKDSNKIISEYISKIKNEISDFYSEQNNKNYQSIYRLPAYKDIVTENVYYSFFDLINLKNIGHYVIIKKNGIKMEINIKDYKGNSAKGIIIFPNESIYVGNLIIEKVIFNNSNNSIKNKNYDSNQIQHRTNNNDFIEEVNDLLSEKNTNNNYPNNNNNNGVKDNFYLNFKGDENIQNHLIEEKHITEQTYENTKFDPFKNFDLENIEFIEKIVNASPYGEGILIQKNQIIHSKNFENDFIKNNSQVKIITENYELETKVINQGLDSKSISLFDYENKTKYEGEAIIHSEKHLNNNCNLKISNITVNNENNLFANLGFSKITKEGKGKLWNPYGDEYEGEFKNDQYDGEGVLYQPIFQKNFVSLESNNNKNKENDSKTIVNNNFTITKGTWTTGKLNGKGFIINNKSRENCVWRYGRLINSVVSLNRKVKLNKKIFEFMDELDLINIAYDLKNKAIFNYLTKDNSKNLIRLKIFEGLSFNIPENDLVLKKFISINDSNEKIPKNKNINRGKEDNILNHNQSNSINQNLPSRNMHFYNKMFFEFLCKENNFIIFFDTLFENSIDSLIPTIAVKCNGGYPNKLMHYSNAFDPERTNSYTSNYVNSFGKDVDITGVFLPLENNMKKKVLEKYSKFITTGNSDDKMISGSSSKNELIKLDVLINHNKNYDFADLKNDLYNCKMGKCYEEIKRKILIQNKNNPNSNNLNIISNINKDLIKFLFSIDFNKIYKYKKRSKNPELERSNESRNLTNLQTAYKNVANNYDYLYIYNYNLRVIDDVEVFQKIKKNKNSKFCLNKILIDIPLNVHILNKLSLPAKTLVFFLYDDIISMENLLNLDFNKNISTITDKADGNNNLKIDDKILEIANDNFLIHFFSYQFQYNCITLLSNFFLLIKKKKKKY